MTSAKKDGRRHTQFASTIDTSASMDDGRKTKWVIISVLMIVLEKMEVTHA
jgi:hypothetical protein